MGLSARNKTVTFYKRGSELITGAQDMLVPGRRVAVLLSPDAFHRVMGCPAIHSIVIPAIIASRELKKWKDFVKNRDGAPNDDEATKEMNAWLKSSSPAGPETISGRASIDSSIPPPCGTSITVVTTIASGATQSDIQPILRRFDTVLDEGKITSHYAVGGNVEIITGDVAFDVYGDIYLTLSVNNGAIAPGVEVPRPAVGLSGGGLSGDIVDVLGGDLIWNFVGDLGSIILADKLTKAISAALPNTLPLNLPQGTLSNRVVDVQVHSSSLLAIGLVSRIYTFNAFSPALFIDTTLRDRMFSSEPMSGQLSLPKTDWGCPAAQFNYVRSFWVEDFTITARARDIALPVTLSNWRMEMGNFSWGSILGQRAIDPRITWSGLSIPLTTGLLSMHGKVEHLSGFFPPTLHGPLLDADVRVQVTGDPNNGWRIRLFGEDGNFYIRFTVDGQDVTGKQWTADTFILHNGEQIELPPEYEQHRADCDQKFRDWFGNAVGGIHIIGPTTLGPGVTVMNNVIRDGIQIQNLLAQGDVAAFTRAQAAIKQFGPNFFEIAGQVSRKSIPHEGP